jgi:hypothetical protein
LDFDSNSIHPILTQYFNPQEILQACIHRELECLIQDIKNLDKIK